MTGKKQLRPTADKTRAAILKAATKLFAKKGFSGTSISEIAAKAKLANQSLIYHHFGSKEKLWRAVKDSIMEQYQSYCDQYPIKTNQSLQKIVQNIIKSRFDFLNENREVLQIMRWQKLESSNAKLKITQSIHSKNWFDFLTELQQSNKINKNLNTEILSLLIHTLIQGAFEESHFSFDKNKAKTQQEYLKLISDILHKTMAP